MSDSKIKILALTCEEPYSISVEPNQNVEVEFSDFFIDVGQNVTLIPHLLKSGEDSMALYYELEEQQIGGQLIYIIDSNDQFLKQMLLDTGVCFSFYSASFPPQQMLEPRSEKSSNFENFPFSLIFLDHNLKITAATDLAVKQLSYFLSNEKVKSVLENALSKALVAGGFHKLELLNFFGYCFSQQFDNGWLVYLVNLPSSSVGLNLLDSILKFNHILLSAKQSKLPTGSAISRILDQAILLADKFLPRTVRIEVVNSKNYSVSESSDLTLTVLLNCFLALAFKIEFSGKIEVEVLAKGELDYITISVSAFGDKIHSPYQGLDGKAFDFLAEKQFEDFFRAVAEYVNSSEGLIWEIYDQSNPPCMVIKIKSFG